MRKRFLGWMSISTGSVEHECGEMIILKKEEDYSTNGEQIYFTGVNKKQRRRMIWERSVKLEEVRGYLSD